MVCVTCRDERQIEKDKVDKNTRKIEGSQRFETPRSPQFSCYFSSSIFIRACTFQPVTERASTKLRLSFKAASRSRNLSNGPLILRLKTFKAFLSFCKLPIPVSPNSVPFSSFEALLHVERKGEGGQRQVVIDELERFTIKAFFQFLYF